MRALDEESKSVARSSWIVYVDLDAFYIACEIRERPELAGRPVIVGPPPTAGPSRGVVLSASYEARRSGVRSAQPVGLAARLCPDARWVPPDFPKYERASAEVRSVLRRHASQVLPYSIDEAALVLEGGDAEGARAVAQAVQRELKEGLQLPASLGVARSRVVAKIATDRAKPGGIVVVLPEAVANFLAPLPVRAVPGVGPKTEALLHRHGFDRIGDLATARSSDLVRTLGGFGRELVAIARGDPIETTESEALGPRSRSTDHTFAVDVDRWEEIEETVRALAHDLGTALDREDLRYGAVGVGFRWADFSRTQRLRTLPAAGEGWAPLAERAVRLAHELWETERAGAGRAVRTVSVRAERLSARSQRQVSLDRFAPAPGGSPPFK